MSNMVLYSTGCPKCNVLKKKLNSANIEFEEITDVSEMESLSISAVPVLKVDNKLLPFAEAVKYINEMR